MEAPPSSRRLAEEGGGYFDDFSSPTLVSTVKNKQSKKSEVSLYPSFLPCAQAMKGHLFWTVATTLLCVALHQLFLKVASYSSWFQGQIPGEFQFPQFEIKVKKM